MNNLTEAISTNIPWIKDIFTIIFTVFATVLAVLTYKRARATILQPIRNEVIKKQVEILTEILEFLASHNHSNKNLYDYFQLLSMNIEIILDDFGVLKLTKKQEDEINKNIKGWVLFLDDDKSNFIYVIGNLDDYKNSLKSAGIESNDGEIEQFVRTGANNLNVIFYTKDYFEGYSRISNYADNPLLPIDITKQLLTMKYDGKLNLLLNLEETIIEHIRSYYALANEDNLNYNTVSSLNRKSHEKFGSKRFKHEDTLTILKGLIRSHLRIDEKW